jgi:hypothetical protein
MKKRTLVATLVAVMCAVLVGVGGAQAQVPMSATTSSVLLDLNAALNAGDMSAALAAYAGEVSLRVGAGSQWYVSADQIAAQLEKWQSDSSRQYRVLSESTINVARGVDVVFSEVEVSDSGLAWGQESIITQIYNGKIQRLDVTGMRPIPISYRP